MAQKPNLFWQHLIGDPQTGACVHLTPLHPGGHPTTIQCTHITKAHPGGDPTTVPCVHFNPATRRPLHPGGDPGPTVPCVHLTKQHPAGDPGPTAPCTHLTPLHPAGDTVFTPCAHPMVPTRQEFAGNLIFYTNNTELEDSVISAVQALRNLGVRIAAPRPLNIFNHDWLGTNRDPSNPAWSRYEKTKHSIQITADQTGSRMRDVLHHEMGHALLGHSCVRITSPGGAHTLTGVSDPALAMSEGWAHFVALAIQKNPSGIEPTINYQSMDWENMSVSANPNVEYCVGCCLWDLFDSPRRRLIRRGVGVVTVPSNEGGADQVALAFTELFRVYSPSLNTLADGPIIQNIGDYIKRLKQNNPNSAADIDKVKLRNVG